MPGMLRGVVVLPLALLLGCSQERIRPQPNSEATSTEVMTDSRAVDELIERGEECHRKGDFPAAIAAYTDALRLDPSSALAYNARGGACLASGKYDESVADYTAAIRLSPSTGMLYGSRALGLYAKGDHRGAIADNSAALRLGGKLQAEYLARLHFARGMAYEAEGEAKLAAADFERARELDPSGRFDRSKR